MDRQVIIITADERQERLASLIDGKKTCCSWEECVGGKKLGEIIYVLPIPVSKLDKDTVLKKKLKEELINYNTNNIYVFGGVFNQEWIQFLEENQIRYFDFMKLPEVVAGNAYITAEATVAEVLRYSRYSISGQNVLVTGYGCCGQQLARIFATLGAKVTVAARRDEVRKQVVADGYDVCDFTELTDVISQMHTIINTVPAMVLMEEQICKMHKDSLIIDIASKPGGTDFDAAKRYGVMARLSLGLPGIYTTTSSAKLLKDAIYKYAPLQDDVREEQLWIFQIIV